MHTWHRRHFETHDPYVDIHFDVANRSVFALTYKDFEGKLFYRDEPIGGALEIVEHPLVLKHGRHGKFTIRQFVSAELRDLLTSQRGQLQELAPNGNFCINFCYVNRNGEAKDARWTILPDLFDISVPNEPEAPSAAPSPIPIRGWNMQQALHWWHDNIGAPTGKDDVQFFDDIRQFARDGSVKIWGRPECVGLTLREYPSRPYEVIPPEHWRDHNFDWDTYMFGNTEELISEAMTPTSSSNVIAERFADLRVTSVEVKALWPEAKTQASKKKD